MKTAGDYVRRSLRILRVIGEGVEASAEQMTDGLEVLHAMLHEWSASGVTIAPPQVEPKVDDIIRVSDAWQNAIVYNLAVEYASEFGIAPLPKVTQRAMETLQNIKSMTRQIAPMKSPKWLTGLSFGQPGYVQKAHPNVYLVTQDNGSLNWIGQP